MSKEKALEAGAEAPLEAKGKPAKKVQIMSLRQGPVKAPCGTLIGHLEVKAVSVESAEWLEKSFPGLFKRVS